MKSTISTVGKVLGGMKVSSCKAMEMNVKIKLYRLVVVPSALYCDETLSMGVAEKKRLNVMKIRCGVIQMD